MTPLLAIGCVPNSLVLLVIFMSECSVHGLCSLCVY
jgi:hypothetical protein